MINQDKEKHKMLLHAVPFRVWSRVFTVAIILLIVLLWVSAAIASAADLVPGPGEPAPVPSGDALTAVPLGVVIVSFFVTALGYVLNYVLPFLKTEPAKAFAHAVYQAIGVVLYELAFDDGFGFNEKTLVAFIVALGTYGFSHGLLYKPGGVNALLGGGRNRTDEPRPRRTRRHAQ